MKPKELHEKYASAVAFIAVETPDGDQTIGSAFHFIHLCEELNPIHYRLLLAKA